MRDFTRYNYLFINYLLGIVKIFLSFLGSLPAYQAAFTSLLVKMRRRVAALQGDTTVVNTNKLKVSHFDVLSGGKKNFSVIKTRKVDISMLTGEFNF